MILLDATTNQTPPVNIWVILSAVAAILSAISAFRSSLFAKKALDFSGQSFRDRQANFVLYLINGYRWTCKDDGNRRFLLFHITLSNKSDSKSSFKAELEIEYIRTDHSVARVTLTHDENFQTYTSDKSLSVFANDIRIDERGMQSKWLIFEQPTLISEVYRIEKYSVIISDTHANRKSVDSIILKEMNND